jgi:hypothetical protein
MGLLALTASCTRYQPPRTLGSGQINPRLLSILPWSGKLHTATANGSTTTYHYDWFGRVLSIDNPSGTTITYEYLPPAAPASVKETFSGSTPLVGTYTLVNGFATTASYSDGRSAVFTPTADNHLASAVYTGPRAYTDTRSYGLDGNLAIETLTHPTNPAADSKIVATAEPTVANTIENHGDDWKSARTPNPARHWDTTNLNGLPPAIDFSYQVNALGQVTQMQRTGNGFSSIVTYTYYP